LGDKMPGYSLLGLIAATPIQFAACRIQLSLSRELTPRFAYPGGNSLLPFSSTGVIILLPKKLP
jgi:hypothetical protein